jgi:uncharacterized membrane protein YbhN (UPF0104 family)
VAPIAPLLERVDPASWPALAVALVLYLARLGASTRAWRNIVAAAYPDAGVRWRDVFGATTAGMAAATFVPAKGGELLRVVLLRRRIRGAAYSTIASTLLVESLFPFIASTAFLVWAVHAGAIPGLRLLPRLDVLGLLADHWIGASLLSLAAAIAAVLLARSAGDRVSALRERVARGLAAAGRPRVYLARVVPWQALDWGLRLAALYWFLRAFGLPADAHNAFAVQVAQNASALVPLTPSGIGSEQALIVSNLAGTLPTGDAVGFSVGMKMSLLAVNLLVGLTALALMARTLHWRRVLASGAAEE